MEDVTDPELVRVNPATDRTICLYGYVRGTHFRNKSEIHIPGTYMVRHVLKLIQIQMNLCFYYTRFLCKKC